MHKIVNGVKIDLTKEEEEAVRAEWKVNEEKGKTFRAEHEAKENIRKGALNKIYEVANLTPEEIAVLKL